MRECLMILSLRAPVVVVEGDGGSPDDIKKVIRELVGPIAEPSRIIITNQLPSMGKGELRKLLKEHLWGFEGP